MFNISSFLRRLAGVLIVFHLLTVSATSFASSMVSTRDVLSQQMQHEKTVDRKELLSLLNRQDVQKKLQSYGVNKNQVKSRINNLTDSELVSFNQKLQEAPAGGFSALGVIVVFLILFIITDALCATDIFSFVKCANK